MLLKECVHLESKKYKVIMTPYATGSNWFIQSKETGAKGINITGQEAEQGLEELELAHNIKSDGHLFDYYCSLYI